MKNKREWLIRVRNRLELSQQELADLAGLSLEMIKSLEAGRRGGSDKTWEKIENAIDSLTHDVTILDSQGKKHTFQINGDERPLYEMLSIATEYGYDITIVSAYMTSMVNYWQEAIQSQYDITHSDEKQTYDKNVLNALKSIAYDQLKLSNLIHHFKAWLGVEKN